MFLVSGMSCGNSIGGFIMNGHNPILVGRWIINGDSNGFDIMVFGILMGTKLEGLC